MMMTKKKQIEKPGWIKLHRKMLDWEWYDDLTVWRLFTHILLMTNFIDKKWHGVTIKRGSLVTSSLNLAEQTHLSRQQVRTSLDKLESTNEITIKTTNKYTEISVNNYDTYQENNQQITNKQPAKIVPKIELGTKKQPTRIVAKVEKHRHTITNKQPTSNQQVTTTKEGYKKDKNNIERTLTKIKKSYSSIKDIGEAELVETAERYQVPLSFVRNCYDSLVNYCESHGKRYKNYLAALRNFVKNDALKIRKEVSNRVSKRGIDAREVK